MAARRSRVGTFAPGRQFDDVTLWTMERHGHVARCALSWRSDAWELRVLMDDDLLLSERCRMQVELFAVAGGWRDRLRERGWSQPAAAPPVIEAADDWRALTPS